MRLGLGADTRDGIQCFRDQRWAVFDNPGKKLDRFHSSADVQSGNSVVGLHNAPDGDNVDVAAFSDVVIQLDESLLRKPICIRDFCIGQQ